MGLCGDVHPHRGGLRVVPANMISLHAHYHTVYVLVVDGLLLGKPRLIEVP